MFRNILKRPVLGIVISVLIVFLGCLAVVQLPISQFPKIAPTVVNLFIAYPGASANDRETRKCDSPEIPHVQAPAGSTQTSPM